MQVSYKQAGITLAIVIVTAFAFGRFSAPEKVKTETKIVTQTATQDDKATQVKLDQDQHLQIIKTETKKPDGTVVTVTQTQRDTDTKRDTNQTDKTQSTTSTTETQTKEVEYGKSKITISALIGLDVTNLTGGPVYGASASRPFLGPICLGVWGFTNKTGGVSLGLQF